MDKQKQKKIVLTITEEKCITIELDAMLTTEDVFSAYRLFTAELAAHLSPPESIEEVCAIVAKDALKMLKEGEFVEMDKETLEESDFNQLPSGPGTSVSS